MSKQRKKSGKEIRYPKKRNGSHRLRLYHKFIAFANRTNRRSGSLYLVELTDGDEKFLKVGVTTTTISRRFRQFYYTVKKVKLVKGTVSDIFKMETKVLQKFKKHSYKPKRFFSGHTECFDIQEKKRIIEYIRRIKK
jgi:hypothetical protein